MSKKLYVGNLPFSATEDDLTQLFSQHGEVESVAVITDRETGRPRGFAFVEMTSGAEDAISSLNETEYGGRNIRVNEARPRDNNNRGGGRPRW